MVQVIDHESVEGDKWIKKLLKERWMVQAVEGAIDCTSDRSRSSRRRYGSGSCRRSGGLWERWTEQWMVQAMDQEVVERTCKL